MNETGNTNGKDELEDIFFQCYERHQFGQNLRVLDLNNKNAA
jgi:hypothetical protein